MGCANSKQNARSILIIDPTSNVVVKDRTINKDIKNNPTIVSSSTGGLSDTSTVQDSPERITNTTKTTTTTNNNNRSQQQQQQQQQEQLAKLLGSDQSVLSELRTAVVAGGDLSHAVVRIETPFGKPIEEVYSGVRDGKILGSGASGTVRLVTHRTTGIQYAVKCLDILLINSKEQLKQLRDEIFIMCQLDHPNIVRIEEVYESTTEIFIVQELCVGGDLFDRLDEQPGYRYNEVHCAKLVKQMLGALHYIHSRGIIHRDLKLENFLFTTTKQDSTIKMIDFGLSKHFEIGQQLYDRVGTPYTVAPEILLGRYDEKCDVWAIGVITYLLICGETPFGGLDGESLALVRQQIMSSKLKYQPTIVWDTVSTDAKNFVQLLLTNNPIDRPSAKDCQSLDWVKVWAAKSTIDGGQLNELTLSSLLHFKEKSDIQKLLSEILSFTLLPEQIEELRKDFEQIDINGDGEITLESLKKVLISNSEIQSLGVLSENDIIDVFDSIRVNKDVMTIRWHEFLAAGLSQARIDDRNLRLAFDRIDYDHKGFITYNDLDTLIGSAIDSVQLETMWADGLVEADVSNNNRITFHDFKLLMKGQTNNDSGSIADIRSSMSVGSISMLSRRTSLRIMLDETSEIHTVEESAYWKQVNYQIQQQQQQQQQSVPNVINTHTTTRTMLDEYATTNIGLTVHAAADIGRSPRNSRSSSRRLSIVYNKNMYRKNREMRLSVLEATKKFDIKRNEKSTINSNDKSTNENTNSSSTTGSSTTTTVTGAGLIMKRGILTPSEIEDEHYSALFGVAAKRGGRCCNNKASRNKTISDISGLLDSVSGREPLQHPI